MPLIRDNEPCLANEFLWKHDGDISGEPPNLDHVMTRCVEREREIAFSSIYQPWKCPEKPGAEMP